MTTQLTIRESTGKFAEAIRSPEYTSKFQSMLPTDVSVERFTAVVLRAVQENPKLLAPETDKTSLFLSCQRAAQDGLLPDGREGALVMYGNKVQWQPMIGGLRKRLAGAGFDLRTEIVYENDTFDYDLGDEPRITHKPFRAGDRGKVTDAYAIATNLATGEKYREIMSKAQLDDVAAISKSGNSGPWKGAFRTEMDRKTVGKRLIKSLPIDDRALQAIIARDNEQFDVARPVKPSATAAAVQAAVRAQPADEPIEGTFTQVTGTAEDGQPPADADADHPFAELWPEDESPVTQ